MNSSINQLKIASILDIILGVVGIINSSFIYGILTLVVGIIILSISESQELDVINNKKTLIFLAIINIVVCFPSALLIFSFCDRLSPYEKYVNSINAPPKGNEESKKIDILLKLGVGMVIVSGILFATTSWEFITDITKVVALILIASLFLGLSVLTEKKLKLYKTSYMYWILSLTFYTLTIIGLLYFGILGNFLTYYGNGESLAYFITYIVISAFCYVSYLKYHKNYLAYLSYLGAIISLYNLFLFINLDRISTIALISTIVFVVNALCNNKILSFFSKVASYVIPMFVLSHYDTSNELMLVVASAINIININYLIIKEKDKNDFLGLIISYILIICSLIFTDTDIAYLFITIYSVLISMNLISKNDNFKKINYFIYTILSFAYYIDLFNTPEYAILIPATFLLYNLLSENNLLHFTENKISKYLNPVAILALITSIYSLLDSIAEEPISMIYPLVVTTLLFCLLSLIKEKKRIYLISSLILTACAIFINADTLELIPAILLIASSAFLLVQFISEKNNAMIVLSYITLLTSVYLPFIDINIFDLNIYLLGVLFIWAIAVVIIAIDNKYIKIPSYFYIILPVINLIECSSLNVDVESILICTLYLYIVFLILKFLIKNKKTQVTVGIIGIILSILASDILLLNNVIILIYIGLIALILIIIGYRDNDYNGFFIFGIILTILNILIQLKDIWFEIPAWLYLLIVGLGIILVVTYIQIRKQDKD